MPGIGAVGASSGMSGLYAQAYYASHISAARSNAVNPSQPELPVEPVSPVRRVTPDAAVRMLIAVREPRVPTVDDLNSAAETLARMRVQYPDEAEPQAGVDTNFINSAGVF